MSNNRQTLTKERIAMKYQGVCIAVKNVNLSKKFYQDLFGLEVFQDYGKNVSFGSLSLQEDFAWLLNVPKEKILSDTHNMELYFEEDNFDEFIKKLDQYDGIKYLDEAHVTEAAWGQRSIRFYDLDGHIIEVGENLKMVVKRFFDSGMTMEETSKRMDVSVSDLEKLLKS
jgi:catechol 2,3-dioxygenase-like lactoylglutathione lyase family enzyme